MKATSSASAHANDAILLKGLNPEQKQAVLHGNGPLLILAGAGSGKTKTMTHRLGHLVSHHKVSPRNILALSFTNRAARELAERARALLVKVKAPTQGLTVTTFHSLCARLLREFAGELGFSAHFSILDESDAKEILRELLRNCKIDDRKFDLGVLLSEISNAKTRGIGCLNSGDENMMTQAVEDFFFNRKALPSDFQIVAATIFPKYAAQLRALHAFDFDDLLGEMVRALQNHPSIRERLADRFRYLLVDEFQDTNAVQFRLLTLLTNNNPSPNLCVVGDDDQSIYSWRGADSQLILNFTSHFPNARTLYLTQNYRSTQNILEAANELIKNNSNRYPKRLWSTKPQTKAIQEKVVEEDRAEAKFVADEISLMTARDPQTGRRAREFGEIAILYRSNSQSRLFEEALRMEAIPYTIVGGLSFLDRKEVRNVLSVWKWILNPADEASFRRILNWPARGIGRQTLETLGDLAFKAETPLPIWCEKQIQAPETDDRALKRALPALQSLLVARAKLIAKLQSLPPEPSLLSAWGKEVYDTLEIRKAIEEDSDEPAEFARKWDNAEELLHALGQTLSFHASTDGGSAPLTSPEVLREFLTKLTLDQTQEEEDKERKESNEPPNQVTLLTLHGAKGLEYPVVFLVGWEDGFLPHQRTIDAAEDFAEERRLAYVGITRAKDTLYFTRAKHRVRYGKKHPRNPSRFLLEVPEHLRDVEDISDTPPVPTDEQQEAALASLSSKLNSIRDLLKRPTAPR